MTMTAITHRPRLAAERNRGAVGNNLGQRLPDFRRIESHRDNALSSEKLGILDHSVHGVTSAIFDRRVYCLTSPPARALKPAVMPLAMPIDLTTTPNTIPRLSWI